MSTQIKSAAVAVATVLLIVAAALIFTAQPADNGHTPAQETPPTLVVPSSAPDPEVTVAPEPDETQKPEAPRTKAPQTQPRKPAKKKPIYRDCREFPSQAAAEKWWKRNGRHPQMDTNRNGHPCDELRRR